MEEDTCYVIQSTSNVYFFNKHARKHPHPNIFKRTSIQTCYHQRKPEQKFSRISVLIKFVNCATYTLHVCALCTLLPAQTAILSLSLSASDFFAVLRVFVLVLRKFPVEYLLLSYLHVEEKENAHKNSYSWKLFVYRYVALISR